MALRIPKVRLDRLLVEKGLASSQEKARALIYAGMVRVDQLPALKPGKAIDPELPLEVKQAEHPYVGRGGVKLEKALADFRIEVRGKTALDIGASTGGFTHCLLLRGIKRVYAIDVGYGQLAWEIRQDPRVKVMERKNVRFLDPVRDWRTGGFNGGRYLLYFLNPGHSALDPHPEGSGGNRGLDKTPI